MSRRRIPDDLARLEALFVPAITLGMRPGEIRALTWDHLDQDNGIIHIARPGARPKPSAPTRSARPPNGSLG